MTDYLSAPHDYNLLSLADLIEARDLFHLHLVNKQHVVATAIGRYRIRRDDPWPPKRRDPHAPRSPRTLGNSQIRPYSWPCVLVFVDQWADPQRFTGDRAAAGDQLSATDLVPPALYMPNGKVVPVCVVEAKPDPVAPEPAPPPVLVNPTLGGGLPIEVTVQGRRHLASLGCLVTDGHFTYALTNRHVTGAPGEVVTLTQNGVPRRVGVSSDRQLSRLPFEEVYPGWPGRHTYVNLDVGLIQLDDLRGWTAQVYGIGPIGRLADLNRDSISLRLIGCPVAAHGGASGATADTLVRDPTTSPTWISPCRQMSISAVGGGSTRGRPYSTSARTPTSSPRRSGCATTRRWVSTTRSTRDCCRSASGSSTGRWWRRSRAMIPSAFSARPAGRSEPSEVARRVRGRR